LGFKDWILKEKSSEKGVKFLERAINSGFNLKPEYKKRYQTYVISDTLIIASSYHELSDHCFLSMISSYLMKSFLNIGLPLRGAISYGECIIESSKNRLMVLGEGIVEAATNESLLDCFCIVQSLSCMKDFSEQVQKEGSKFHGSRDSRQAVRVLSSAELDQFTSDAAGFLIQLLRFGLISPAQFERIVDKAFLIGNEKIDLPVMKVIASRYVFSTGAAVDLNLFNIDGDETVN